MHSLVVKQTHFYYNSSQVTILKLSLLKSSSCLRRGLVIPPSWKTIESERFISGDCLESLKNTAVYEGDENIMMSLIADPNNVKWAIIPSSDEFGSYTILDYDGYRDRSLAGLFYLDQGGLLILNATTAPNGEGPISTSGLYIAQCSNDGNRKGVKLLVVR